MSEDLPSRLRRWVDTTATMWADRILDGNDISTDPQNKRDAVAELLMREAADEIERLRAELTEAYELRDTERKD